jgi:hypothetical protein
VQFWNINLLLLLAQVDHRGINTLVLWRNWLHLVAILLDAKAMRIQASRMLGTKLLSTHWGQVAAFYTMIETYKLARFSTVLFLHFLERLLHLSLCLLPGYSSGFLQLRSEKRRIRSQTNSQSIIEPVQYAEGMLCPLVRYWYDHIVPCFVLFRLVHYVRFLARCVLSRVYKFLKKKSYE